ncbi:MAG: hypothetical protein ACRDNB_03295 [Gaiellaceae bacterium]
MSTKGLLLGLAALVVLLSGCRSDQDESTLFVLLTDNRLLRVSGQGEVLSRTRLAPAADTFASFGNLLDAGPDGGTVYALARGARQRVVVIDADGIVVDRIALPRQIVWRRLAVGPRTGRLYLAGDVEGSKKNELGAPELSVHLLVLSPSGERLELTKLRDSGGRDWYVHRLTVASDESSVLVSYHGSDTTGTDVVTLAPVRPCADSSPVYAACLAHNHGYSQWVGDEILAATGESRLALLDRSGKVVRELPTGLENIHLMAFAVAGRTAYAFGDCVKGNGISRVSLDGDAPRVLRGGHACGDTAVLMGESTLVLGRRWARDPYGRGPDSSLVFVDLEQWQVGRVLELPEDPADVLAVG